MMVKREPIKTTPTQFGKGRGLIGGLCLRGVIKLKNLYRIYILALTQEAQ